MTPSKGRQVWHHGNYTRPQTPITTAYGLGWWRPQQISSCHGTARGSRSVRCDHSRLRLHTRYPFRRSVESQEVIKAPIRQGSWQFLGRRRDWLLCRHLLRLLWTRRTRALIDTGLQQRKRPTGRSREWVPRSRKERRHLYQPRGVGEGQIH